MTDARKAASILTRHAQGWRFSIDWPPGFKPQAWRKDNRPTTATTGGWRGDRISAMGEQRV